MDDNRMEISFDGEEEQPKQQPASRLVITNDDLVGVPDHPQTFGGPPQGQPMQSWQHQQKKPGAMSMSRGAVLQGALAGLIGGFLAWAITEPIFGNDSPARDMSSILIEMGVFGGLIGGIIGCCLGAADGVVSRVWEKALRAGSIGLGIGAGGGFLGGLFGQLIYGSLLHSGPPTMGSVMLARTIGWSIVGIFVGLGQGVGRGSGKRVVNGLLGGLAGGLVAGILFDPIGSAVQTGTLSRAFGITILGVATGLAVGLVEEMRKEAWLSVVQGPLSGKQFILYELRTRIGSSPKCEITLMKDPGIMPEHTIIENRGGSFVLVSSQSQAPTLVNGQPTSQARLQGGSIITVGSTSLLFEEKAIGHGQ